MKNYRKYSIALIFLGLTFIFPQSDHQAKAIGVDVVVGAYKGVKKIANSAANMADKIHQAKVIADLVEDLVCMKVTFDNIFIDISYSNCMMSSEIKIVDLEYSEIYIELYKYAKQTDEERKANPKSFSDMINKAREIVDKMKELIQKNAKATKEQSEYTYRNVELSTAWSVSF